MEQVELLLMESGDWLIGVDPESVRWIDYSSERAGGVRLESLLGLPEVERSSHVRGLWISDGDMEHVVWVDHLIGIESIDEDAILPLPLVLRNFDAPAWVLGVGRHHDRLALVVDLLKAIRVDEGNCAR